MKYFRKYAVQIISALLVLVLVQSVALFSVLVALEYKDDSVIEQDNTVKIPETEQTQEDMTQDMEQIQNEPQIERELNAASAAEILADARVIAHGMGVIDGVTTLNCLESFLAQYEKGVRVFEVDFRLTSDMQVVLRHDWRAGWQEGVSERNIPTLEEFRQKPLLDKYTALSFKDLLLLMVEYPDICIVTDSKFMDAEIVTMEFEAMLNDARELGLSDLFDRIVVQVYSELMFKVVDNIYDFPHYIYTLYNTGFDQSLASFEQIAQFCNDNGIDGVTMWSYWWKEAFAPVAQEHGLSVYVHTVNDAQQARELIESGVSGVYTDGLTKTELYPENSVMQDGGEHE